MSRINSRAKGAAFERKIAKLLSEWWGETLRRTPGSGGWCKERVTGDIAGSDTFMFSVECKCVRSVDWMAVLTSEKCDLSRYIKQAVSDAGQSNKVPLLIVKENRKKEIAFVPYTACPRFPSDERWYTLSHAGMIWVILPLEELLAIPKEAWLARGS